MRHLRAMTLGVTPPVRPLRTCTVPHMSHCPFQVIHPSHISPQCWDTLQREGGPRYIYGLFLLSVGLRSPPEERICIALVEFD
eukprot:1099276-Amorphochlora_amoeboformis.AAC.1